MFPGSSQLGFLKEPKDSHGESSIMRTLAKVSSFQSPRQAHPWQTAPEAPSYGLQVFSKGPWGGTRGERGPRHTAPGGHGDIRNRGSMCQRWLYSQGLGKG